MDETELMALKILAKEFEYAQGLHVPVAKMQHLMDLKQEVPKILEALEDKGLINCYKEKGRVKLAKISWKGLNVIGEVTLKFGLGKDHYENYDKGV